MKIIAVTNRCDNCKKAHRGVVDDSDSLEDGAEDTELPAWWAAGSFSVKQPNPEFAENEERVKREVSENWKEAVQRVVASRSGTPLNATEINELREAMEVQARGDEEIPPMVVMELDDIVLCDECVGRLQTIGLDVKGLLAPGGKAPWAPVAVAVAPVAVAAPALAVAPVVAASVPAPVAPAPSPEPSPSAA